MFMYTFGATLCEHSVTKNENEILFIQCVLTHTHTHTKQMFRIPTIVSVILKINPANTSQTSSGFFFPLSLLESTTCALLVFSQYLSFTEAYLKKKRAVLPHFY